MPAQERKDRMQRLRQVVKERNVYRWAHNLVSALARVRIPEEISKPEGFPAIIHKAG